MKTLADDLVISPNTEIFDLTIRILGRFLKCICS